MIPSEDVTKCGRVDSAKWDEILLNLFGLLVRVRNNPSLFGRY
jgi:hypothetical protein